MMNNNNIDNEIGDYSIMRVADFVLSFDSTLLHTTQCLSFVGFFFLIEIDVAWLCMSELVVGCRTCAFVLQRC